MTIAAMLHHTSLNYCAGTPLSPSPGGESLSHTELYMKYVDATQQSRQERAYRRRNEVLLEQVADL